MIYNFMDIKNQDDRLEDELQKLRNEYQKPQMTKEQLENLKCKMKEAAMENNKKYTKKGMVKFTAAAALIAGFVALPNTSSTVAHAMGQIGENPSSISMRAWLCRRS